MYSLSLSEICFSDACLVYISSGISAAIIRYLHVCHPYGGRLTDYYYPARRQATFFYAAIALQFPYVIFPSDVATWTYIRVFGVLYYPVCFAMLYRRYFDRYKMYSHWKGAIYVAFPLTAIVALGIVSQVAGDWLAAHASQVCLVGGVAGLLLSLYFMKISLRLKRKIDKYQFDNFSCESDFPFPFAQKVIYLPILWFAMTWIILITGNQWIKAIIDLVSAVWMVLFLAVILHPQRARVIVRRRQSEMDAAAVESGNKGFDVYEEETDKPTGLLDDTEREAVHQVVADIIKRMYKNPGLLKSEVIAEVEYGRKTQAKEYLTEVGFYNFVNAYRLEHARLYKEAHPLATLEEVAAAAGFRDRFALRYAKGKVTENDRRLIGDFHPETV